MCHSGDLLHVVRDLVEDRVALVSTNQNIDGTVERRREQQCLAVGGGCIEYPAHRWQKAHVSHAVRLVDDHEVHARKRDITLTDQVLETSGASDCDIDSFTQGIALSAESGPSEEGLDLEVPYREQGTQDVGDLSGELPCRGKHQCRRVLGASSRRVGRQRQGESEGLSRARGRLGGDISAGHRIRDGLRLNRQRMRDAAPVKARDKGVRHSEISKGWSGRVCTQDNC